MLSNGSLSPGRTLCMGSPHLALLPPGCIAVCSVVGREKKSPGTVAASRGLNIPEPSPRRVRVWTDLFRCRNHLETRIARNQSKVKHQFVGICQLSVQVIFVSVCQFGAAGRPQRARPGGRPSRPRGGPAPRPTKAGRAGAPAPARGPARGGPGGGGDRAARAAARAPEGPAAAHPGGQAQTRRTGSEGRSSGPQPGGPEPGGGRKGPKGPARGPRPARTTERRGEKRRPRRGVREGGDNGREQTRPRERDARAEAKMGKGGRSRSRPGTPGGDPQPASAFRFNGRSRLPQGKAGPDRVPPKKDRAAEGGPSLRATPPGCFWC